MSDLPDLHGWLPARVLARRLGISPSTIRSRARRGVYEVVPSPISSGALYREKAPADAVPPGGGEKLRTSAGNGVLAGVRGLSRDDGLVLALLPSSASKIAPQLGLAAGTVDRSLHRLQRAGFARRCEPRLSGPRGGRPEVIWEPVKR